MLTVTNSEELTTLKQNKDSIGDDELDITTSLEELQTDEQRRILDTVAQVRKCGLDSILSLPQLVVCGDQSAGKSSVLEALTEIPFPRNDNLCTRYATEIHLRRGVTNALTIKVIPDDSRSAAEKAAINAFYESISDFNDLPRVMGLATAVMGISATSDGDSVVRAFARDVLSIQIEGPSRPQLTLVDIPGLIQTSTKGVSKADVSLVSEITDHYISSPRTICLAVVSATHDAANQPILQKVRDYDPQGDRTLGIITKPDRLSAGSGSESKFIELARNEDVFFRLGWHVLKNRSYEEANASLEERKVSELKYFRNSRFNSLAKENVGIDSLRDRLSLLLFDHVKQELPQLRRDLEEALGDAQKELTLLGSRRSKANECKTFLTQLSLNYYEICKAAVNGYYEGQYFQQNLDVPFSTKSPENFTRLRAVVQHLNIAFEKIVRMSGHKYHIDMADDTTAASATSSVVEKQQTQPIRMCRSQALRWVKNALARTRGKELIGSFNPLLIGELFWEQSSNWNSLAMDHIERIARVCEAFLKQLLEDKCPKDVRSRLWTYKLEAALKTRRLAAVEELQKIMDDSRGFPINYNHHYTDNVARLRIERQKAALKAAIEDGTSHTRLPNCNSNHMSAKVNSDQVFAQLSQKVDSDMESVSGEEVLDRVLAIYKVLKTTFVANVTTQVIERHVVRDLEAIFSPVVVSLMTDSEVEAIAAEPKKAKRQREFLEDRVRKLEDGQNIFRSIMETTMV